MFTRTINLSVKNTIVKNRPADSPSYVRDIHLFILQRHLTFINLYAWQFVFSPEMKILSLQITHKRVNQEKPYPLVNLD